MCISEAWWLTHAVLALRRLKQKDCHGSERSLGHIANHKTAWLQSKTLC